MLDYALPFLCLAAFVSIFAGVIALGAISQKKRKGFYFYNDAVFAKFWESYSAEPSIRLENIDSTTRGGTLVSYKIGWLQLNVYINKIGIFYYSSVQYNQTYGSLLLFDKNDLDKYEPRAKMPLHSYEFVEPDTLILHCQAPTPIGRGKGRLVLKGIAPDKMKKIQTILREHFDSLT